MFSRSDQPLPAIPAQGDGASTVSPATTSAEDIAGAAAGDDGKEATPDDHAGEVEEEDGQTEDGGHADEEDGHDPEREAAEDGSGEFFDAAAASEDLIGGAEDDGLTVQEADEHSTEVSGEAIALLKAAHAHAAGDADELTIEVGLRSLSHTHARTHSSIPSSFHVLIVLRTKHISCDFFRIQFLIFVCQVTLTCDRSDLPIVCVSNCLLLLSPMTATDM